MRNFASNFKLRTSNFKLRTSNFKLLFILHFSFFILHSSLASSAAYQVPDSWKPLRFPGADEDFVFLAPVIYEQSRTNYEAAVKSYPFLDNLGASVRFEPKQNADGSWTFDLDHPSQPIPTDRPFAGILYPRVSVRPRDVLFETYKGDAEALAAFLKKYPKFMGFSTCEYMNDIDMPIRDEGRAHIKSLEKYSVRNLITDAEWDELLTRSYYAHAIGDYHNPQGDPKAIAGELVPAFLQKLITMQLGDPKWSIIGEGTYCVENLAAYEGVGGLGIETTRNYCPYQIQEMFCRGAARQFARPWYWYIATYFMGYEKDGSYNPNSYFTADDSGNHGPNKGISISAIERTMWKAYLSGAASIELEAQLEMLFNKTEAPWKLSECGRIYEKFYHVCKNNERGTPYTPIAILVSRNRGVNRALGRPFTASMKCPYTQSDFESDALISTILNFPSNLTEQAMKAGVEQVMVNTKYGDLFDALTPDFPDQTSFRRILKDYPCAILCNEYDDDPEMIKILKEYKENGGKLVRISSTLAPFPAEGEAAALKKVTRGEPERFPEIEKLLDSLVKEFSPIKVKGDIQWGLNRTSEGWLLYFINNSGVIKFSTSPMEILPGGSEVSACLSLLNITEATEIISGAKGTLMNGKLITTVPHGGVQIFKLK